MSNILDVKHLSKQYSDGRQQSKAINDLSFELKEGESMAVIGPSGSGKSTLLHLLAGLDLPSGGEVEISGQNIFKLKDKELSHFRNRNIGFVFQFFYLQDYLSARENVAMPMLLNGQSARQAYPKADALLAQMGLQDKVHSKPRQLSGGEMQRVAIARALINEPKLVLADEPTGNLDRENADKVLDIFDQIAHTGVSIVVITHDKAVSERFGKVLKLDKPTA